MIVITPSMLALGVAISLIAYIIWFYAQRFRLYKEAAKFPGPPTLPFIGNAYCFIGNSQDMLMKSQSIMEKYPSPFRMWMGPRLCYVVYNPEQLKRIFMSPKTIEKDIFYDFMGPWLGSGLFTAKAAEWRIHRKFINPTFSTRILESFVEVFSVKSEIFVKQMETKVNGKEFDIFHYITRCTFDILCETAMGVPSEEQTRKHSPYLKAVDRLLEIMYTRIFKVWLHPDFIFNHTSLAKDMHRCIKIVHEIIDNVIKQKQLALKSNGNNKDENTRNQDGKKAFLDLLIELSQNGIFTYKEVRDEVNTMITAGYDTSAIATAFVVLMLASHPDIQDKVYEELYEIYGDEDTTARPVKNEDLHKMKYMELVIKETLRLFPTGPIILRQVNDDLDIGDYTLIKGTSVVLGIIQTHRSEEYWDDPLTFNPDRFLPDECAKRHPYTFIPFSGGPRMCVGVKFAMMSMKVIIATFLRKYVIMKDNIVPDRDIRLRADVLLRPVEPIMIRLERRIHTDNKVE